MDGSKRNSTFHLGRSVSCIRFFSMVPRVATALPDKPLRARHELCEFSLGLGPCGRVASRLWYRVEPDFLHITQESFETDGQVPEFKEFTYRIMDIMGRIETIISA